MNHKQVREASERYIKAMRDTLGIKREVKLALPPTAPFNDDEYEAMLPTAIVTNLGLDELTKEMGERVIDRLREGDRSLVIFDWASERGAK